MFDTSWLKVFTFFVVWAVIWLPIAIVISRFLDWQPGKILTPQQKLILLGSLYLLSPIVFLWKIESERFSFASLGFSFQPNLLVSMLSGLALSLISLIIIFVLESIFDLVSWHWERSKQLFSLILPILALSLFISVIEEVIFRGYIFNTFVEDYPCWFAATISSLIFASLHLIWERKETLPQIPGLWLMGMILVGARLIDDGNISLAIGLHGGWIWGLTCIDSAGLLSYKQQHSWLTGINRQPLAGIAGISCLIITGLALWLVYGYGGVV
ncbi:CPBP family intramembrane metalloprotease [Waterburya agarophytonicola K14]|uniref:CPBP family intramembrane metalloprotease n=2 Tax=Waterburya TaxID=2886915 RepID=A0A964BNR8_9CYAN|nr:CPBP family intramembrane metalloprotease [Waterburya agarophytonicola KI4]